MGPLKCNVCRKPIKPNDKFCPHCGISKKKEVPVSKSVELTKSSKVTISSYLKWIIIAMLIGIIFGWIRYWIGYYVLIQGIIAGLLITWMVKKIAQTQIESLSKIRFKMSILLFFSFMIAQAIGFGVAQPVFDPLNWMVRVWNRDTTESVFGIFSTAGVVSQTFSEGLSGGFWLLLSLIDLFFMFFFILISMPLTTKK